MERQERLKIRLPDAPGDILGELLQTAVDRILLRIGEDVLPPVLDSIAVDATVKLYRRIHFEGIESEKADTLNTTFFEDILAEYDHELHAYMEKRDAESAKRVVRFL